MPRSEGGYKRYSDGDFAAYYYKVTFLGSVSFKKRNRKGEETGSICTRDA